MRNPWPGLAAYTEESLEYNPFNGRWAASVTLSALIRRNLFVTLYGRSGIGKTSLLQAGVFPLLRGEGLNPIIIRLDNIKSEIKEKEEKGNGNKVAAKEDRIEQEEVNDRDIPASEHLWSKIITELKKEGVTYIPCDDNDIYSPEFKDVMVLRNLFSAGRFKDADNKEVTPVIVLDQFEEVLYKAPTASRLLVSQLYALIDDNYNLTIPHPTWHEDTIFRIVVSIREDDLFLFEDCIDKLNCVDLKSNRYRLLPLTIDEAKEVVANPEAAKEMFEADKKGEIVNRIIKISCNIGENVNTLMLSLICHVLYDEYATKGKAITEVDLNNFDDIIKIYYLSILKERCLPEKEIDWFEDSLIDEQGRRKFVYESDFKKYAPKTLELEKNESAKGNQKENIDKSETKDSIEEKTKNDTNTNKNNRLFNISQGRVEFIHDQLAASVFKIRNSKKSKRYNKWSIGILIGALTILSIYSLSFMREGVVKGEVTSLEKVEFHNNTKVTKYIILEDNDECNEYYISDCPNLKTIEIKKNNASLIVVNCPGLVSIIPSDDFIGNIRVYNCENLIDEDNMIIESDSFKSLYAYQSEYTPRHYRRVLYDLKMVRDEKNNRLEIYGLPFVSGVDENRRIDFKVYTNLNDSIKNIYDCYVPFGYKDRFSQLYEFKPFRSINELPVYSSIFYICKLRIIGALLWFKGKDKEIERILSVSLLLLIFEFFFCVSWNKYKKIYKHSLSIISLSFFKALMYALFMALVAIIAFMALYWSAYNILLCNQPIASVFGVIGCILCLFVIFKADFYSFGNYFKNNYSRIKTVGFFEYFNESIKNITTTRLFKHIKSHYIKYLEICIVVCIGIFLFSMYESGKKKRIDYLNKLSIICRSDIPITDYAMLPTIIDEIEKQHGSVFYPFFTDSLYSLKEMHKCIDTTLVCSITPESFGYEAKKNGLNLPCTDIDIEAISMDGGALCIRISNDYSENKRLVYYNFLSGIIDTITPAYKSESFTNFCFSPSGGKLMMYATSSNNTIVYDVDKKEAKTLNFKKEWADDDLIMTSDTCYYSIDNGKLQRGNLDSSEFIYNFETLSHPMLHYIDGNNIGVYDNYNYIVFNVRQDSVIHQSRKLSNNIIGKDSVRGINYDYVVSGFGVFDIKQDSLTIESDSVYMLKNRLITVSTTYDKFVIREVDGKLIKTINKVHTGWSSFRIVDNYLYAILYNLIEIHSLGKKINRRVMIPNYYKMIFDLE